MCPIDDGVIKYDRSGFQLSDALEPDEFDNLEKWRETLFNLHLIGEYLPEKIGYGNLSKKIDYSNFLNTKNPQFVITGTQTGGLEKLNGSHYTRVIDFDLDHLKVDVLGPVEASSEALTHAAVYASNNLVNAVFHIHDKKIWKGMIENEYDFTPRDIPYGTKEMALKVQEIVSQKPEGLIVMKGHEDGVISYGESLTSAGKLILEVYNKFGG